MILQTWKSCKNGSPQNDSLKYANAKGAQDCNYREDRILEYIDKELKQGHYQIFAQVTILASR